MFGERMSIFARSTCAPSGACRRASRARGEVLLDAAVAVGRILARLGQRAAVARISSALWLST
jgi:hypothetical protein